jgi:hypothetical protein
MELSLILCLDFSCESVRLLGKIDELFIVQMFSISELETSESVYLAVTRTPRLLLDPSSLLSDGKRFSFLLSSIGTSR